VKPIKKTNNSAKNTSSTNHLIYFKELADQALYQAKSAGRNKVSIKVASDSMMTVNPHQHFL
jgi:hypothetical protein